MTVRAAPSAGCRAMCVGRALRVCLRAATHRHDLRVTHVHDSLHPEESDPAIRRPTGFDQERLAKPGRARPQGTIGPGLVMEAQPRVLQLHHAMAYLAHNWWC